MISEKFPQFIALLGYFLPIWFIGISGSSEGHCPLSALYFSKNKKNGGDDNWNPIKLPLIWFFLMLTISIAFPSMMSMEFSSNLKTSEPTISISCKKNLYIILVLIMEPIINFIEDISPSKLKLRYWKKCSINA